MDAVRSVFAQTHRRWELLLIDDGSTDGSLAVAQSINDERVKVVSDGRNLRLAARLNQVPELASFDFIARMDADDLMSPHRIERQLCYLLEHPEMDLVSTGVCSLTDDNEPVGTRGAPVGHQICSRSVLAGSSGIVHASLLGRRAWFARNRYREDIATGQDANLWVRCYAKGDLRVAFLPDALYYYREDGNVALPKLERAYRETLRTIRRDAGAAFSRADRMACFFKTLAKLVAVKGLWLVGAASVLRQRRNGEPLSAAELEAFSDEIAAVRQTKIPLKG